MPASSSEAPLATVALITLGCAKNEVDSRTMRAGLEERGFSVSESMEAAACADFIILNTCAFIEAATEESLDAILELSLLERVRAGEARLLVAGCLPSRYGAELEGELPEVSAFVSVAEEPDMAGILARLLEQDEQAGKFSARGDDDLRGSPVFEEQATEVPWAYVKISDGCSRHCSYCTIPSIRGPYESYSYASIKAEVESLVRAGAKEIILIGQDTGIWSDDTRGRRFCAVGQGDGAAAPSPCPTAQNLRPLVSSGPHDLASLLEALAMLYPETWFRVLYVQPEGVSDELLAVLAAHENIAPYLDIPLQHASSKVLSSMNRKGSSAEYLELVARIREAVPDVVLRTTVMCGFPGESEEDFAELCGFLEAACFDYVGLFVYSCEEGTAASTLPEQVSSKKALKRLQVLRDLTDSIAIDRMRGHVGRTVPVLICGQDEEGLYGRTQGQAPDIDGVTYVSEPGSTYNKVPLELAAMQDSTHKTVPLEFVATPGAFIHGTIIDAILYDLFAEVQ